MIISGRRSKSPGGAIGRLRDLFSGAGRRGAGENAGHRMSEREIDALAKRIILPSLPVSDEEIARATHQDEGQRLARQDRWDDLARRIRHADRSRLTTPGGETASLLLAFGARSDIVSAAEDALHDGATPDPEGIMALEDVLQDYPDTYPLALVVGLAHLDIAWAWHSIAFTCAPEQSLRSAQNHIARADALLTPLDAIALDAPSVLAAQCALAATNESPGHALADDYARLIALDPESHRHMRALGRHMLPLMRRQPNIIEVEARRTAAQTRDIWQAGGYTWVYLDALASCPAAADLLDAEFFIEGMDNIIARRDDQHVVNLFAAFCAVTMAPGQRGRMPSRRAEGARARVHECLDWVLSDHLQELHPLIWSQCLLAPGQPALLPPRRALVVKGRQTAMRIIAAHFAHDIADGSAIAFSPHGMYRLPAL